MLLFRAAIKSLSVNDDGDETMDEELDDRDIVVDVNVGATVATDETGEQCLGSTRFPVEELVTEHLLASFRHTEDNMVGVIENG